MKIKELKEILTTFEDSKTVNIFLKLTSNFGILYDVEAWGNNNGHLDLWIYDSVKDLKNTFESLEK